jgi:hypothetical protein
MTAGWMTGIFMLAGLPVAAGMEPALVFLEVNEVDHARLIDQLEVAPAALGADRRSVRLSIPGLVSYDQLKSILPHTEP